MKDYSARLDRCGQVREVSCNVMSFRILTRCRREAANCRVVPGWRSADTCVNSVVMVTTANTRSTSEYKDYFKEHTERDNYNTKVENKERDRGMEFNVLSMKIRKEREREG